MKNKYKVGDKVRCITDDYDTLTKGEIYTVLGTTNDLLIMIDDEWEEDGFHYKAFEPITKTLDNLEVGDILILEDEYTKTVEAVCGNLVALSNKYTLRWYSLEEVKKDGWKLKTEKKEELEPKVKKAIKLLEEKGYKVEK